MTKSRLITLSGTLAGALGGFLVNRWVACHSGG